MFVANGWCEKYYRLHSENDIPGNHKTYSGQCRKKTKCGHCKEFKKAQTPDIVNSELKYRCVYECEHYRGFYNDHKDWIDCKKGGVRYFSDDPNGAFGKVEDLCICFCKDFKKKQGLVINEDRFIDLEAL